MAGEVPLRQIKVSGLTSLGHAVLDLSSPVTLLVGPNGAGKSNVVDAFEMLGRVIDQQLNDHLLRSGGFAAILHRPTDPALTPSAVEIEVWGEWQADTSNGYKVRIEPGPDDLGLIRETTMFHDRSKYERPHETDLGTARESRLRAQAASEAKASYVLHVVTGCRVFHFDDTSADAPPKRRVDPADNLTLAPDAQNIAAVLLRLRSDDPSRYQRIVRVVRSVAPYFDDFVLEQEGSAIRLRWRERGLDSVFSADNLSDGTLRFVCLAALLLQGNAPGTIVLDEPSSGCIPLRSINWLHCFGERRATDALWRLPSRSLCWSSSASRKLRLSSGQAPAHRFSVLIPVRWRNGSPSTHSVSYGRRTCSVADRVQMIRLAWWVDDRHSADRHCGRGAGLSCWVDQLLARSSA